MEARIAFRPESVDHTLPGEDDESFARSGTVLLLHVHKNLISCRYVIRFQELFHCSFSFMLLFSAVYYLCGTLLDLGVICYAGSRIYKEH